MFYYSCLEICKTDQKLKNFKTLNRKENVYFNTYKKNKNSFTGTGRYQIVLLLVCGLVNMACAISTTAVSFIVPVAEKDFNMSTINKAMLNGAPFLGR